MGGAGTARGGDAAAATWATGAAARYGGAGSGPTARAGSWWW